ncbi:MAG TPA: polyketide synthase dehydratase domain-containing protein, partial [Streptosporangiaceae bacterium]
MDGSLVCSGQLSPRTQPWLADHAVAGTVLLPGTAFVELALVAGYAAGCGQVAELALEVPLVLPSAEQTQVQVVVGPPDPEDPTGPRTVEVYARPAATEPWTRHASGQLAPAGGPPVAELTVWPPPGAEPVAVDGLYEELAAGGYGYGPAFRGLRSAWRRGDEVFAEVMLPAETMGEANSFGIHPALLDAALHAAALTAPGSDPGGPGSDAGAVRLPFAWSGVSLHAAGASALRVRLSRSADDVLSLVAADDTGAPVVSVGALVTRPVPPGQLRPGAGRRDDLFTVEWVPVPAAEASGLVTESSPAPSLVLAGAPGSRGDQARAEVARVLEAVQRWLAGDRPDLPAVSVVIATETAGKAAAPTPAGDGARLAVVTRGAVSVAAGESVTDLAGAAVWGLVRSAQSENPGSLVLVDLPPGDGDDGLAAALASGEPELAVRGGQVYARRLGRPAGALAPPDDGGPWQLEVTGRGTLDGLSLVPFPGAAAPLEPGQARVAVRAAGLNFRDVVVTLGLVDRELDPGAWVLGSEIAGIVLETGPGVTGLALGDRVLGLAQGGFGPVAVADAATLIPVPGAWSWAEAASVPVAFTTAWYGLVDLAGARRGQKILVHAAAGGVGMAAVTIARHLGLEVFATASPGKHAVLAAMGLDEAHIASSRDAGFEAEFLAATGGAGVDIVLNALAGELTDASLRLLSSGGAFIELGKTDIRDAEQVARDHPGVRYRAFSTGEAGPDRLGEILAQVVALLAAGELALPPVRCWDVR